MNPLVLLLPLLFIASGASKAAAKAGDSAQTLTRTVHAVANRSRRLARKARAALKAGKPVPKLPFSTKAIAAAKALRDYLARPGADWGIPGRPSVAVAAAQKPLGVKPDGIVGPETRIAAAKQGVILPPRPPISTPARIVITPPPAPPLPPAPAEDAQLLKLQQAANALKVYLSLRMANFGTKRHPSKPVRDFQTAAGITADGIYGPQTRAAAARVGVSLPPRRK